MSKKEKVTTKPKKKRRLNIKRALILVVVIFLFVGLVKLSFKINISNIEVVGNDYLSDAYVIKLAGLNTKTSFLGFNSSSSCKNVKSDILISSCKIKRKFDLRVVIVVEESKPLFYYDYSKKVALSDGSIVNIENKYGVPTLINYVPEKILNTFISRLTLVSSDIIRSVSEIEYTPSLNANGSYIDEERFMLSMNDGNIVYINNRKMKVLNQYKKIYASIGDAKGYINLDSDYDSYVFQDFESAKKEKEDLKQ